MVNTERLYIELQHAIQEVGFVECSDLPDFFFPDDFLLGRPEGFREERVHYSDRETRDDVAKIAKGICSKCPVQELCLGYATAANMKGIWGGTTEAERKARADLSGQ